MVILLLATGLPVVVFLFVLVLFAGLYFSFLILTKYSYLT